MIKMIRVFSLVKSVTHCTAHMQLKMMLRRSTVPVCPLFVPRWILVIGTERTTGRNSLQVELRHVWHSEVDWAVVSDEWKRNIL